MLLGFIKHIYQLPLSFFSTRRTGEITSRFSDANRIIDALASTIITIVLDLLMVITVSIFLFIQNYKLAFLSLLILPVYLLVFLVFYKPFKNANKKLMQSNSLVNSLIIEDISGMESIKSLGIEKEQYRKLDSQFTDLLDISFKYSKIEILQDVLKILSKLILNVAILWVGASLAINGNITIGQLIAFNSLFSYFFDPLENIMGLQSKIQSAQIAQQRLEDIMGISAEKNSNISLNTDKLSIEFKKVKFKYGYGEDLLKSVSLKINPKEKIAIVGNSGSGKSTLFKLLVGFYTVTKGKILVNDTDLIEFDMNYIRRNILYLPQMPHIFTGTIAENITIGSQGEIDYDKVIKVAKIAEIHKDIMNLPLGYTTEIHSDATELSGGQMQRLALARAIYMDSPILILDEATSNLDIETEEKILSKLLKTSKTIIFIAHRLSIAKKVDKICVLSNGKIAEVGTHQELSNKNGIYSTMLKF